MTLEERIHGLRLRALYRAVEVGNASQVLLEFVRTEVARCPRLRILDAGCGAARNAAPMAALGGAVVGTDVSWPMLEAARRRVASEGVAGRVGLVRAPMDYLPLRDANFDLVVAHGICTTALSSVARSRGAVPSST